MLEENNKYNAKLFENIEDIKLAVQFYISENNRLETELNYYKNAYENRVNEFLENKE